MPGVRNKGLFASHHLKENLPSRRDWQDLTAKGTRLAEKRGRELITELGFSVKNAENNTLILSTDAEPRAIAVLLEDAENFEAPSGRFPTSPVALGLSVAAAHSIPWVIMMRGSQIRLHPSRDGVGVGQKGQAETFLELNLAHIDDGEVALLPLIFLHLRWKPGARFRSYLMNLQSTRLNSVHVCAIEFTTQLYPQSL